MNKKLTIMIVAAATAGVVFARPGPGFHGGFRGGHAPMHMHGGPGFHHHHHHHHGGWGVAGAVLGTAALVHEIVRPAPVVVAAPPPVVVAPAPVATVYPYAPVVTYAPPPPPPPPMYYRAW